jgi:acetyltransferase-like isoleucine patch superfamily enzyme
MTTRVVNTADVAEDAEIGDGTTVWHLAQVREGARLGEQCVIGRGAYIDTGVVLGDRCKVQNHALVYAPAVLGDGVFIGPAAVLTNDTYPRSVDADGRLKRQQDWQARGISVGDGAAVGARAVVLAGVSVGAWSMIGAGAVVTRDVPDHALVVGVPARRVGWVGRAGVPMTDAGEGIWTCPETGQTYVETDRDTLVAS